MELPSKATLRIEARGRHAIISKQAAADASAGICDRIRELPEWAVARTVAMFAVQPGEPDLAALLAEPSKIFSLPRVVGRGMEFRECGSTELLIPGPWGLSEPDPERCRIVTPGEMDLVLIPGMAFSRCGGRLGRGGGYYDRFLADETMQGLKVGVCFAALILPHLPGEDHDHAMDAVVTESETIRCG